MKTITVKQPWASLIVAGIKDIENRTWKTNFRGRVLIHAGVTIDNNAVNKIEFFNGKFAHLLQIGIDKNEFPLGAIIGSVEIVDCVQNDPSVWAEEGVWHWKLKNPIKFDNLIPCKGKLSFWDFPDFLLNAISGLPF